MKPSTVVTSLQAAQINFYVRNGYLALEQVATAEEVEEVKALYDRMFAARVGRETGDHFDLAGRDEEGKAPVLAQILQPSKHVPELKATKLYQNVSKLICELLGAEASVTGDHAINKPPRHGAETPWHQDEAYWDPMFDYSSLSVWVPLQPATVRNGCMHFVPGSHRLEIQPHQPIGNDPQVHGLELVSGQSDVSAVVACELPAGGATIHHCRTLHYAPGNRTDDYRRALIIIGGLPPVPRSAPRRFPWLEQRATARAERARAAA